MQIIDTLWHSYISVLIMFMLPWFASVLATVVFNARRWWGFAFHSVLLIGFATFCIHTFDLFDEGSRVGPLALYIIGIQMFGLLIYLIATIVFKQGLSFFWRALWTDLVCFPWIVVVLQWLALNYTAEYLLTYAAVVFMIYGITRGLAFFMRVLLAVLRHSPSEMIPITKFGDAYPDARIVE